MARPKSKTMIETFAEDAADQKTTSPSAMAAQSLTIRLEPIEALAPHPDNPRAANVKSPKFLDLVESIRANGVLEPLTVRECPGPDGQACFLQVLSGHRRLRAAFAAGLKQVPVRDLGLVPDDLAYDIVAMSNLHEDLTPLEEGKRAAVWLDKYGQDAKAVASKLGKTEHWVLTHAMIERNLIPAWKEAIQRDAEQAAEDRDFGQFARWTAEHWRHIARLPAAIQEHWLAKIVKGYPFNPRDATADEVGDWLETDKLFLAKAPFDWAKACAGCPKRTDAISQLLWQDPDVQAEDGQAVRCLDPKCWQRQEAKAIRADFLLKKDQATVIHNIVGDKARAAIVPISMVQEPEDYYARQKYQDKLRPIKAAFRKDLVRAEDVTEVKEGTKGAVLGIVVAGRGKGSTKWVKIEKKAERSDPYREKPKTPKQLAKEKEEEANKQRWTAIGQRICRELAEQGKPQDSLVALCGLQAQCWPDVMRWDGDKLKPEPIWTKLVDLHKAGDPGGFWRWLLDVVWSDLVKWLKAAAKDKWEVRRELARILELARLFGINAEQRYNELTKETGKSEMSDLKSQKGRGKKKAATLTPGVCRVCGCTEDNCRQCVEKTGEPCHWVDKERTLCSACAPDFAGPVGECVGDCGVCKLEVCAKTDAPITHGPKATQNSKLKTQNSKGLSDA